MVEDEKKWETMESLRQRQSSPVSTQLVYPSRLGCHCCSHRHLLLCDLQTSLSYYLWCPAIPALHLPTAILDFQKWPLFLCKAKWTGLFMSTHSLDFSTMVTGLGTEILIIKPIIFFLPTSEKRIFSIFFFNSFLSTSLLYCCYKTHPRGERPGMCCTVTVIMLDLRREPLCTLKKEKVLVYV